MNLENNIETIIIVLLACTLFLVFFLFYSAKTKKSLDDRNARKLKRTENLKNSIRNLEAGISKIHGPINENIIAENSEIVKEASNESFNNFLAKMNEKQKTITIKDIAATSEEKIHESEKADFHFSSLNLLGGYFGNNGNWVFNPDLSKKERLIDKQTLLLNIQNYFNSLVKDGIYLISEEDLLKIKKSIWSGNLMAIVNTVDTINKENGFKEKFQGLQISGEHIVRKVLIHSINSECYLLYSQNIEQEYNDLFAEKERIYKKKNGGQKLNSEEDEIIKTGVNEQIIIEELDKILGKFAADFLEFDFGNQIMKLKISYKDIFRKEIGELISYYKKKKNIKFIYFYL